MILLAILCFVAAGVTSLLITGVARHMALRLGMIDEPGHRKVHTVATPRNGGIGIFWGLALPMLAGLAAVTFLSPATLTAMLPADAKTLVSTNFSGILYQRPLALLLMGATLGVHILGLLDDRKALPPWPKLLGQLVLAALLVGIGETIERGAFRTLTMLDTAYPGIPYAGFLLSCLMSVLWITALTNAFNFLDNMDGLSAGVAFICATMFLIAAYLSGQWFVCGLLVLFMGATLGFLFHNFPPATIFMGDGGSMVLGFFLSALTIRTTYYHEAANTAAGSRWYTLAMPLIVMAVPLYDLAIVSALRIAKGRSPMTGDTNHFSHRLVRAGFPKRTAVLIIYAVTFALGISAPLLSLAPSPTVAVLIALQVFAMLVIIAILERVGDRTT